MDLTKWGPLSLGLMEMGHKANHSPIFNAQAKNAWSYTSTPLHGVMHDEVHAGNIVLSFSPILSCCLKI
jgi:hypothetical protein